MTWDEFIKSRWATLLLGLMLVVVVLFAGRILLQKRSIDKQIANLQMQADRIGRENAQLDDLIQYFGTDQYQEKQAREKLNLRKEGEYVVILPNDDEIAAVTEEKKPVEKSNPVKWLEYFFN